LRILIHSINYAPEVTGIGKYNGEMSEWLAERGHEVRIVTAPPYYPMWRVMEGYSSRRYRRERRDDVGVWRCPVWVPANPSGLKRLLHLASFAASSFPVMLSQILWRPDVVMVTEPPLFCLPQARLIAKLSGAKVWLHVLDFEVDAALHLGMLRGWGKVQRLMYKVERFLMRGVDRISTISEKMRERIVKKGFSKDCTLLFPNWAETDFVLPLQRENEVRRELGVGPEDTLVLHAGNMGEKQGLDLVLEAAERLRERTEIQFIMVGAGAARKRLEQAAGERKLHNVHFFPVQPLERLPLMLAAGDIHLIVQRREAADLVMPSKLTNILSAGRPSIATVDPDTAVYQVLNEHECGLTTQPESVTELVAGISTLAEAADLRVRLGQNARRYAESYLKKDKILADFEIELRNMV
jgi:colanic acid biosynthesis glycosyl transferase WcaI